MKEEVAEANNKIKTRRRKCREDVTSFCVRASPAARHFVYSGICLVASHCSSTT